MAANFHLSLPCRDVYKTRVFYSEILKAKVGRINTAWLDINLYGNQITFVKPGDFNFEFKNYRLGEQILPSFHFGIIMDVVAFGKLYREIIQLDIEPREMDSNVEISAPVVGDIGSSIQVMMDALKEIEISFKSNIPFSKPIKSLS